MVSFYSFSYAIFGVKGIGEFRSSTSRERGISNSLNLIFYGECNGGRLHINLAIICTSKCINPILYYLYSELDCLTEDVVTLR